MASFNYVISECRSHAGSTSEDTVSTTPALGDVLIVAGYNSTGANAALTGGGMTWTRHLLFDNGAGSPEFTAVFEATAGTPSEGVLTFTATDSFVDFSYVLIRGVDLTYNSVVGQDSTTSNVDTLTVSLTTSGSPGGLVAHFFARNLSTPAWAQDSGWTEQIDENNAVSGTHQVMDRFIDDTEVIGDAAIDVTMIGVCLEYDAVAGAPGLTYVPYRRYF